MQIRQKISIFIHKKKYFSMNLHNSYDYNIILNYTIPKIKGEVNHFSVMNFAFVSFIIAMQKQIRKSIMQMVLPAVQAHNSVP